MAFEYRTIIAAVKAMGLLQGQPSLGQTIGGTHANSSEHYAGRAVDFGQSNNNPAAIYDALLPLANHPGSPIDELFYDPSGHGWKNGVDIGPIGGHSDHVHVGVRPGVDLAKYAAMPVVTVPANSADSSGHDPFGDAITKGLNAAGITQLYDVTKATAQVTETFVKSVLWLAYPANQKRLGMMLVAFLLGLEALILIRKGLA